jgi:HEAT repeat protein
MLSSPDRDLRLAALRAAHWLDDDEARPLFAIAAQDPAPEVRRRLVCYLSWRGAPWAMFELRTAVQRRQPAGEVGGHRSTHAGAAGGRA